jgi:hypothetical protein
MSSDNAREDTMRHEAENLEATSHDAARHHTLSQNVADRQGRGLDALDHDAVSRPAVDESLTLRHLRTFLLGLSAALFVGTSMELILAEHVGSLIQLTPFALCLLGLLALVVVWVRPNRRTVAALRLTMAAAALGSPVGIYEHFSVNLEFGSETQPNADAVRLLVAALTGGSPLLAPVILAVAAATAIAATYSARGRI